TVNPSYRRRGGARGTAGGLGDGRDGELVATERAAREIHLDAPDDLGRRDHVHAAWQVADGIHAQLLRPVLGVAVAQGTGPRLPAAAVVAAGQRPDGVDELMVRIRGEMRGLAPARDD